MWCFNCHGPWHSGISCHKNQKNDKSLKLWSKKYFGHGQKNAQKCPKCKIYIQRSEGCDHMICTNCSTEFCYRCGLKQRKIKLLGTFYIKKYILNF